MENNLPTYVQLRLKGWDWIANCHKDDAENILEIMRRDNMAQFCLGRPKTRPGTEARTYVFMVGVYKKDGGRPAKNTIDDPFLPDYFDTQPDPPPEKKRDSRFMPQFC